MIENFDSMLSASLQLEEPWYVTGASFDPEKQQIKELYSWMRRCRLEPMKAAAVTLMNHRKEIMNYFHDRLTNAICEGLNSLVQAAKRKAKGFNTFEGFKAMIFLVAGKLELDVPAPF